MKDTHEIYSSTYEEMKAFDRSLYYPTHTMPQLYVSNPYDDSPEATFCPHLRDLNSPSTPESSYRCRFHNALDSNVPISVRSTVLWIFHLIFWSVGVEREKRIHIKKKHVRNASDSFLNSDTKPSLASNSFVKFFIVSSFFRLIMV